MAALTVSGTPVLGVNGVAYNFTPTVSGSAGGNVFSLNGTLPPGLAFDPTTGIISGTPNEPGTFSDLDISVVDSAGDTGSLTVSITTVNKIDIYGDGLPNGRLTDPYNTGFVVDGGSGTQTWSVASGTLPAGLSINGSTGVITGTPTAVGAALLEISVTDASGTATDTVTLAVTPILAATLTLSELEVGEAYAVFPVVTNSVGIVHWAVSNGSLPPGLALNALTGEIFGTPTAAGSSTFSLTVTDATQSVTISETVTVASAVTLYADPPGGVVFTAYTLTPAHNGGVGPYTYNQFGGQLPPGLSLNSSTGVVSGAPFQIGSSAFGIQIIDGLGGEAVEEVVITVTQGEVYPTDLVISTYVTAIGMATAAATILSDWEPIGQSLISLTGVLLSNPSLEALEAYWTLHDNYKTQFSSPLVLQGLTAASDVRSATRTAAVFTLFHTAITAPGSITSVDAFLRTAPNQRIVTFIEQKLLRLLG